METKKIPTKLPPSLYGFFWDVDAAKFNPAKYPLHTINRLLDKGDVDAARWVLRSFPKEIIVATFHTMKDFSPWNGVFWSNYLGIPREEVKCLDPSYLAMRKKLWPY